MLPNIHVFLSWVELLMIIREDPVLDGTHKDHRVQLLAYEGEDEIFSKLNEKRCHEVLRLEHFWKKKEKKRKKKYGYTNGLLLWHKETNKQITFVTHKFKEAMFPTDFPPAPCLCQR